MKIFKWQLMQKEGGNFDLNVAVRPWQEWGGEKAKVCSMKSNRWKFRSKAFRNNFSRRVSL